MRSSDLTRRLSILVAGSAVALSVLAAPVSAADPWDSGWYTSLDLRPGSAWEGYSEAAFRGMILEACGTTNTHVTSPSVDDIAYYPGKDAEALLISASVDLDGRADDVDVFDAVCTFAAIETDISGPYAARLSGSYSLTASSPADDASTKTGQLAHSYTSLTEPVFTDVDHYASATLTATGHRILQVPGTVTVPSKPKSAAELQRAKSQRDLGLKKAKKTYDKRLKQAKSTKNKTKRAKVKALAKSNYTAAKRRANNNYLRAIADTPARTSPGLVDSLTPFSLSLSIDGTVYPS